VILFLSIIIELIEFLNENKNFRLNFKSLFINSYKKQTNENCIRIPVITYHRIVSDWEKNKLENRDEVLALPKSKFKIQMKYLKKEGYKTLNCTELYLWYQGKIKLPKKSVLITFDGGTIGQEKYAMPILNKLNMKGTTFIIGNLTYNNAKGIINYSRIPELKKLYPNFDFQSHTFDLHIHLRKDIYNKTFNDAVKQNQYFNFTFLAYPYGDYSSEMIKAYKDIGIKMAFTYGINGYANRTQNIYKIRRIKIYANEDFSKFTSWFK
jgi:peptidoglycan/xylan/chitin deacetylase (PgdA/CDA1 family)